MPRIVIKVNKDPLSDAKINRPREIIEYRWDRIITAILILCLFVAVTTWSLVRLLTSETGRLLGEEARILADQQFAQNPIDHSVIQKEAAPAAGQSMAIVDELPTVTPEPVEMVRPEPQAIPEPVVQQSVATAAPAQVKLYSNRIRSAQLTSQILNRKPVDQLPEVLQMNEQGLLRIYLFTETAGLEGRTIFHHWYLNGKRMARVQLPGLKHPTTLTSSKFIDRHMTGTWTVKVLDDRNQLLASTSFEVRP